MRSVNVFFPSTPHLNQQIVLNSLDKNRFVELVAGRKWRKTSLGISWLFENAFRNQLAYPYVAPYRLQAKNIVWNDHIARLLVHFKEIGVPYKVNEAELSVQIIGGGKVQLFGVDNKDALRGISNWGAIVCDEYDDWEEDIWPTIIRPNLIPNQSPALVMGTPKGKRNLWRLKEPYISEDGEYHPSQFVFHKFRSHDNPELPQDELDSLVKEYKTLGEDYYKQEILAEFIKPAGVVYKEWEEDRQFVDLDYDPNLPLHISFDFGIHDPTAVIWLQPNGAETRIVDYYEASDANIQHFISVIKAKPYRPPELFTGDPAGKARDFTSGISPIAILAKRGMPVRTLDGITIAEQIRVAHSFMPGLFVSNKLPRFRDLLLNYRYPPEKTNPLMAGSNEKPIHDEFSHGMRSFEYWCVNNWNGGVSEIKKKFSTNSFEAHFRKKDRERALRKYYVR